MDARTQAVLQKVLRRQHLSLLQYIGEACPWIDTGEQKALATVRQVLLEDREATGTLTRFLNRRRVPLPYIGAYPVTYTTINFVSLDCVLPLLQDAQRREVAELESELAGVTDAEARAALQQLLDLKRRHLGVLQELDAVHQQPAST